MIYFIEKIANTMSNLLNFALRNTCNAIRISSFRLCNKAAPIQVLRNPNRVHQLRTYCSRNAYDINTNVSKDIILFKYENPKFFRIINIFAICQFVFWNYLSHYAFTTLRDAPVDTNSDAELAWYQRINLGENKYRNGIAGFCFIIGYGVLVTAWMFTLRSVRFLILRKGGKELTFVTYTPFGKNRIMTVPLRNVSAQESREAARTTLPLKVKSKSLFYVLDMRGDFRNAKLYDYTAGLNRRL